MEYKNSGHYRQGKAAGSGDKWLCISRVYEAARESVFGAWTQKEGLRQWWGPRCFTNRVCELDLRPGGQIHIEMEASDGMVFPVEGHFEDIDPPRQLVFTSTAFEDEEGEIHLENLNTLRLTEIEGKTRLDLKVLVVRSTPEADLVLESLLEGWIQSLDKLDAYLVGEQGRTHK
ncbi:MAG: SRPBCC family protein [Flavisolibacter sp.]